MFKIWLIIFKKRKYSFVAAASFLVFFALSYYLTVINVWHKNILVFIEMNGLLFTLSVIVLNLFAAILFSMYLSLLVFRRDIIKTRALNNKTAGFGGAAGIILSSGCPSCGTPLLGLIGLPLGLLSLPLMGIELKLASIAFLLSSIYLIEKNIKKNLVCQMPTNSV